MGGETYVDVSYRGLEIGRRHRLCEVGPTTAYLEHPTPMPVGTRLELAADGGIALVVDVLRIHEQHAGAPRPPGMRVKAGALDERAASLWKSLVGAEDPAPPSFPPEPKPAAATEGADDGRTEVMSTVDVEAIEALAGQAGDGGEVGDGEAAPDGGDDDGAAAGAGDKPKGKKPRGSVAVRKKKR